MNKTYLDINELSIGHTRSLAKNININLTSGKVLYIKGANGSGKTTFLKTILGKVKPLSGSFHWSIKKFEISYLPQITNPNTNFSFTIKEILELYDVNPELKDLLPSSLLERKWINASGGEKQKVMILTRLSKRTKVLILDEPFNHLDNESITIVSELLIKLSIELGITIILVSHYIIDIPKDRLEVLEI